MLHNLSYFLKIERCTSSNEWFEFFLGRIESYFFTSILKNILIPSQNLIFLLFFRYNGCQIDHFLYVDTTKRDVIGPHNIKPHAAKYFTQ